MIFKIVWLSLVTTSGGVLAGAQTPNQAETSKSSMPASFITGTSGSASMRFALVIAIARSLPSLM